MQWTPHVTVAAVVERQGRYLLVEEQTPHGVCVNQPAGHWEAHETLAAAVVRETLEETGWHFQPAGVLGMYVWQRSEDDITYLRIAFTGTLIGQQERAELDQGILRALWLAPEEMAGHTLRSPLVAACVRDHRSRTPMPLSMLVDMREK